MAFTVQFLTSGPCPTAEQVGDWLTMHGEPFEVDESSALVLRALPATFRIQPGSGLCAELGVTATVPVSRVVHLVFGVSVEAGADVTLAGAGEITRSTLWMWLADEQDRIRISETLERSRDHGNSEEVLTRFWAVVSALRPKRDDRWDVGSERIVEMLEVGVPGGISLEQASARHPEARPGDAVAMPIDNSAHIHCLAWRWLSEAYPGLAESHSTTMH